MKSLYSLILILLSLCALSDEVPAHMEEHLKTIGVSPQDSEAYIEERYQFKLSRIKKNFKPDETKGQLENAREFKSQKDQLKVSYQKILAYKKTLPQRAQGHFRPLSYDWVNEAPPQDPAHYLEENWRAISPKILEIFPNIPNEVDPTFDIMGGGPRLNPKLYAETNRSFQASSLEKQYDDFTNLNSSIDDVNLFREIMIYQLHTGQIIDSQSMLKFLTIESKKGKQFLEMSLVMLTSLPREELKELNFFSNGTSVNLYKKLINLAKSEKVEQYAQVIKNNYQKMAMLRSPLLPNPLDLYYYSI
jgi:hypothetical protein